jgi:GNAT superfamily N-acetyltransferase
MTGSVDSFMGLGAAAVLRPIGIDELADVRYLHELSVKRLAASHLSEGEVAAFIDYLRSADYTDRLAAIAAAGKLTGACLGGALAGTVGWQPANDGGDVARLVAVFVSPLYSGMGLARRLVLHGEAEASRAGFRTFAIRSPVGSAGFFIGLGYDIASSGAWPIGSGVSLPVSFMRKRVPGVVARLPRK